MEDTSDNGLPSKVGQELLKLREQTTYLKNEPKVLVNLLKMYRGQETQEGHLQRMGNADGSTRETPPCCT